MANKAPSNSGTIWPRVIWPRLPPLSRDGQAEQARAAEAKPDGSCLSAARQIPRRLQSGLFVVRISGDQDVRRLDNVGGAEAAQVVVVITPAALLVRRVLGRRLRDEGADQRVLVGFAASFGIRLRLRRQAEPPRLLQQQFANCQRPRGLGEGRRRRLRRMVLRLDGDHVMRQDDAVDADLLARRQEFRALDGAGAHGRHSPAAIVLSADSVLRLRTT